MLRIVEDGKPLYSCEERLGTRVIVKTVGGIVVGHVVGECGWLGTLFFQWVIGLFMHLFVQPWQSVIGIRQPIQGC